MHVQHTMSFTNSNVTFTNDIDDDRDVHTLLRDRHTFATRVESCEELLRRKSAASWHAKKREKVERRLRSARVELELAERLLQRMMLHSV